MTHGLRNTQYRISKSKNLCISVHRVNKNKMDYCIKIMLQPLVASYFAKNQENVRRELCLNVIIPFYIIVCCLEASDVPKRVL